MSKLTEDFLRPFSLPQVALLHTLALEMETYGLTSADVIDICTEKFEAIKATSNAKKSKAPQQKRRTRLSNFRCHECNTFCEIAPVNISKCTAIGGSWKSSIVCSNPACRFTELSEKSPADIKKEVGE